MAKIRVACRGRRCSEHAGERLRKGMLRMNLHSMLSSLSGRWAYLRGHPGYRQAPFTVVLRLLAWRVRCWLRIPAVIRFPQWDIKLFLPPCWRGVAKLIYSFRENYEPELLVFRQLLFPGAVVVDAGASYGIYTVVASKVVGRSGKVLSFEPTSATFAILQRNLTLNCAQNVRAFRAALIDCEKKVTLYYYPDSSRNSLAIIEDNAVGSETVEARPLAAVLATEGIGHVDVIKLDVEGAEELVLRGAREVLKRDHPIVIFEVNQGAATAQGLSPTGTWELLAGLGYRFYRISCCGAGDLVAADRPPDGGNVVAIYHQEATQ